jgi:hypothetical protein
MAMDQSSHDLLNVALNTETVVMNIFPAEATDHSYDGVHQKENCLFIAYFDNFFHCTVFMFTFILTYGTNKK